MGTLLLRAESVTLLPLVGIFVRSTRIAAPESRITALRYALLAPLLTEPETVIAKARVNLQHWSSKHRRDGMAMRYLAIWERVLDDGLDAIIDTLTSPSQEARELRQNSPFAGVLSDETRQGVLKTFRRHWAREHGRDRAG